MDNEKYLSLMKYASYFEFIVGSFMIFGNHDQFSVQQVNPFVSSENLKNPAYRRLLTVLTLILGVSRYELSKCANPSREFLRAVLWIHVIETIFFYKEAYEMKEPIPANGKGLLLILFGVPSAIVWKLMQLKD